MSLRTKTPVNAQKEKPESKRFSETLTSLLAWADLVADEPSGPLLSSLKIDISGFKEFKRSNPALVNELKQIIAIAKLLDREKTAKLLLVRFNEMLMAAKTPRQLRDLALAAQRLPDWAFGDEPDIHAGVPNMRAEARHAHLAHTDTQAQAHTDTQAHAHEASGNGVAANSRLKPGYEAG